MNVDPKYLSNTTLSQIINRYIPPMNQNGLYHSLIQSNLFNQSTLSQMKQNIPNEIQPRYLHQFGLQFNIRFNILKYNKTKNRWIEYTSNNKLIGSQNGILIRLALINNILFLNEQVHGISRFAIKRYDLFTTESSLNKLKQEGFKIDRINNENILLIDEIINDKYLRINRNAHIKSYRLMNIICKN